MEDRVQKRMATLCVVEQKEFKKKRKMQKKNKIEHIRLQKTVKKEMDDKRTSNISVGDQKHPQKPMTFVIIVSNRGTKSRIKPNVSFALRLD